jgi:ring-1,2-phenylacetyl-CoA epoxidase subunit PaaD
VVSEIIPLVPEEVLDRQRARSNPHTRAIWDLLDEVVDPEIPVLSLWDLGVLQAVGVEAGEVVVTLTPTYSGCPAMEAMTAAVLERLDAAGHSRARVELRLSPAWTTDWMSEAGRLALRDYGIAPPGEAVRCPQCGSRDVSLLSEFGSTACKSLYRCAACSEPFDHFKRL